MCRLWMCWGKERKRNISETSSGGGAYLKGKGETQLQLDRSLLKRRIAACTKQLEEVRKFRARQRGRAAGPCVAHLTLNDIYIIYI